MTWDDREIHVTKAVSFVSLSDELAMEYGLIPDTSPPVVLPLRWRIRIRINALRMRLGSWVAGVDLRDED
jgi:hypothetical protein